MKKRKLTTFFTVLAVTLASSMALTSCGEDEDSPSYRREQVNPAKVFTAGLPKGFDDWLIEYDTSGRVIRFDTKDKQQFDNTLTVEYPMEGKNGGYDVIITDPVNWTFYMTLGENGFVDYCKQVYKDSLGDTGEGYEEWWFRYNSDGQMCWMKRTEGGNELTDITYKDGDIIKVVQTSETDSDVYTTTINYGDNPIPNKCGAMFFDRSFAIDLDEMDIAYWAGLLGKATKHLPIGGDYTWVLDDNGYAVAIGYSHNGEAPSYYDHTIMW